MIEYRQMTAQEVPGVAELEKICFHDPWSENSVRSELDNPLSLWIVAMEGETLCGYVGSQTVMEETDMMNIAVSPDYRHRGIGKALIAYLINGLQARGSKSLSLEVRASNAGAIALYENQGFSQVGRRPNYYRNPREDALILRKEWKH